MSALGMVTVTKIDGSVMQLDITSSAAKLALAGFTYAATGHGYQCEVISRRTGEVAFEGTCHDVNAWLRGEVRS
jgi:hypothetical protein